MSRLIDADEILINGIKNKTIEIRYKDQPNDLKKIFTLLFKDVRAFIDEQPTIDAVPVVRCKDCIYYDPPHVEDGGKRYEYSDMPDDAFDSLGTGLVHTGYGVNFGGRCCVDDMKGYSEDKRVFVRESNYCGRAIRKKVTE